MPNAAEYQARIGTMEWAELSHLWERIGERDTPGWDPGKAFEYLVLRAFELDGADVKYPYTARLFGEEVEQIDGAVYWGGLKCLVESKDTVDPFDFGPIAKLRAQLQRRPAETLGIVFSRSGFTEPALVLAQFLSPQSILLWRGDELEFALERRAIGKGLLQKYRVRIEEGLADYHIRLGETP
jgi:Restriction endonuclease